MEELLKKVSELNKEIAQLDKSRLVAKSKKEMIEKSLFDKIEEYKKEYGVNLKGASMQEVEEAIRAELQKVSAKFEEEYKLKEQIVTAIKNGDIAKARKLMGLEEEVVVSRVNKTEVDDEDDRFNVSGDVKIAKGSTKESEMPEQKVNESHEAEKPKAAPKAPILEDEPDEEEEEVVSTPKVDKPIEEVHEDDDDGFEEFEDFESFDFSGNNEGIDDGSSDEKEAEYLFGTSASSAARGTAEYKQKLMSVEKSVEEVEKATAEKKEATSSAPKMPKGDFSFFDDDDDSDPLNFSGLLGGSNFEN